MKSAMTHLLLLLSLSSLACAEMPMYPGATRSVPKTRFAQASSPGSVVYTTPDGFDKVCAFYRQAGIDRAGETLGNEDVKLAAFTTADRALPTRVTCVQRSFDPGTAITYFTLPQEDRA